MGGGGIRCRGTWGSIWTARAPGPEIVTLWWGLKKSTGKFNLGKVFVSWSRKQTCR